MLSQAERNQIIDLINREVVPAIGCTEPIAVALCTARAAETLGGEPEKITVRLSANILKNAMGCLLYTSPSPRDRTRSRMPSSA